MRAWTFPIQAPKSASAALTCFTRGGFRDFFQRLEDFPFEDLHLLLGGLEPLLAETGELEPALVRGKRLFERQISAFHARNDFFQLGEGLLETELGIA
jgi:hypothetical protein